VKRPEIFIFDGVISLLLTSSETSI